jgi:hypothetical protein
MSSPQWLGRAHVSVPGVVGFDAATHQRCFHAEACLGGAHVHQECFLSPDHLLNCTVNDVLCTAGSGGRLCAVCKRDYYRDGQECMPCGDRSLHPVWVVVIIAAGMLAAAAVALCLQLGAAKVAKVAPRIHDFFFDIGRFKVIFSTLQIIGSIARSVDVQWPEPFFTLANLFTFVLEIFSALPMTCSFPHFHFYNQLAMLTLLPLCLVASLWLVRLSGYLGDLPIKMCTSTALRFTLYVLYYFLPTASFALFRVFICHDFVDGRSFLEADYSLQCHTSVWAGWSSYAIFMLALWPIGVPLLFCVALLYHRHEISGRDTDAPLCRRTAPLRFLFEMYKPENYLAEVRDCVRRITLCGLVVFLGETPVERAYWGFLLSIGFTITFREYMPFESPSTNALAVAAHWQISFTFLTAAMLKSEQSWLVGPHGSGSLHVGVILFFLNIVIFGAAMFEQLRVAKKKLVRYNEMCRLTQEVKFLSHKLLNVVAVQRSIDATERRRFMHEDWAAAPSDMTKEELNDAVAGAALDVHGVQGEDEMRRFLHFSAENAFYNTTVRWYWQEDTARLADHDQQFVLEPHWVQYHDSVAAQLEYHLGQMASTAAVAAVAVAAAVIAGPQGASGSHSGSVSGIGIAVSVDLNERVMSNKSGSRGKVSDPSASGTAYSVDLQAMEQRNAKTGFVRKVHRTETAKPKPSDDSVVVPIKDAATKHGGTALVDDIDVREMVLATGGDVPPFPRELLDRTGGAEAVLLVRRGQLVQVQKKRTDGWWFGCVLVQPETDGDGKAGRQAATPASSGRPKGGPTPVAMHNILGALTGIDDGGAAADSGSGWFPSAFVSGPTGDIVAP